MIARRVEKIVRDALAFQAAVAVIGPRQVGKTTLAREIGDELNAVYVDLEDRADREKLEEPRMFLERFEDRLVILDEIHRVPNLFSDLRGIIDRGRRKGLRTGPILGSRLRLGRCPAPVERNPSRANCLCGPGSAGHP